MTPNCSSTPTPPALLGTLLLVEDSRVVSDAIRCLIAGQNGRLRRADSISQALRHLAVYRPDAALIDLGLPDGSGLDLIAHLAARPLRIERIIAMSGDPELEQAALLAGADAFLPKPLRDRATLLEALSPALGRATSPDACGALRPGMAALRDDLTLALDLLRGPADPSRRRYTLGFLRGVALQSGDADLLGQIDASDPARTITPLAGLVQDRLRSHSPL
jgi:CheY-like chemotaxis protein